MSTRSGDWTPPHPHATPERLRPRGIDDGALDAAVRAATRAEPGRAVELEQVGHAAGGQRKVEAEDLGRGERQRAVRPQRHVRLLRRGEGDERRGGVDDARPRDARKRVAATIVPFWHVT